MISTLLATICLNYGPQDECTDRQVFLSGIWNGPESAIACDEELARSERRLKQEGYERMFLLSCETQGDEE